ncbi:sensor histidine kinase [Cutibacterium acnes JCM 18916]|nr:sensor histidine kinase [Cutibacterium acnes JCM 18916]
MGLTIFALFYLTLFWWHVDGLELWYTKRQVRRSAIVGQVVLVVLCALLALVSPKMVASALVYPIAFAVFQMPEVALEITLAIEVVGIAVLVWTVPDLMPWAISWAISVALVTVMGVLERTACRGQLACQAEQDVLARLEEREQVASDVHDLLGQTLTVMAMKAQLAERLIGTDPDAARAQAAELHGLTRRALAQVRELVSDMATWESMLNLPQLVPHSRLPVLSVWSPTRVPMSKAGAMARLGVRHGARMGAARGGNECGASRAGPYLLRRDR